MFLILDEQPSTFSIGLEKVAEKQGLETILLTSAEFVRGTALVFRLLGPSVTFSLQYRDSAVRAVAEIDGVYCGINAFQPELWDHFSPEDAVFAAQEMNAFLLAALAALPCRVVNPPALDTLAGTFLSTPELLHLAHRLGFRIPMVINVESGEVAAELLSMDVGASYADLGEVWIKEVGEEKSYPDELPWSENHFRIKEKVAGKPVFITLIGRRILACTLTSDAIISFKHQNIPRPIKMSLRRLHRELNLNVAEYAFRVMADETWIFEGCSRPPSFAEVAYGDALFSEIVDYAVGKTV